MGAAAAAAGGAEEGCAELADTVGGGGRAGGSFFRGGRLGSWWAGAAGGGSKLIDAMLWTYNMISHVSFNVLLFASYLEERSFNSSSFSVFLAKQKSVTLFWKVTSSCVRSL